MATVRDAERILQAHEDRLSRYPNVVGLGIRSLDESEPGGKDVAVAVYVTRKLPEEKLAKKDRIPRYLELPGKNRKLRVRTRVIEQGDVALE